MDQQSYQYNITRQEFDDLKKDVKDLHKVFDKISDIALSLIKSTSFSLNN